MYFLSHEMLNLIFILEKSYIYIFFPELYLLAGSCVMQSVYNFFYPPASASSV